MKVAARRFADLGKLWGLKVSLSIADQGLFAGASFLLNILLTRWLSPSGYGTFAIAFSVFLFLSGFHNAFVLEPISVLGPAHRKDLPIGYLENLLWTHAGLCLATLFLAAAGSLVLKSARTPVAGPLLGLAIGSPFILSFWLLRRICYLQTRPGLALRGSLVYSLLLVGALLAGHWRGWVTPLAAFLSLGFASAGAGFVLWRSLGLRLPLPSWSRARSAIPVFLSQHWRYAKWVLGSVFVSWLSGAIYVPLIGSFAGLEAAGVMQAMQNPLRPLQNVLTAFGLLLLPWISGQRAGGEGGRARGLLLGVALAFSTAAAVYLLPLAIGRDWVIGALYGRGYYDDYGWLLLYLCLASFIASLTQGVALWLKAFERPNASFWSQAAGALLTISVGAYLAWRLGLRGTAVAMVLVRVGMGAVILYYLVRFWKDRR